MTLEFTDPANGDEGGVPSGIATVQYKWVTDTTTKPTTGLTSVPASAVKTGACTANLTQAGTWYLYYKVKDAAGNTADGYSEEIKKDHYKGSLVSITGPTQGQAETDGLAMTVNINYGPSGAELTAIGQTNPIGTLAPHNGVSTQLGTAGYTTKTTGTNYIYIKPYRGEADITGHTTCAVSPSTVRTAAQCPISSCGQGRAVPPQVPQWTAKSQNRPTPPAQATPSAAGTPMRRAPTAMNLILTIRHRLEPIRRSMQSGRRFRIM